MSGFAIPAHAPSREAPIRYVAALVLLAVTVFPFLCMTVPASAEIPAGAQPHTHRQMPELGLLMDSMTDHGCAAFTSPQFAREGGAGFLAVLTAGRHPISAVEPRPLATHSIPNRDVSNRAVFQVYRL